MKITVIGASGMVGHRVVHEAASRGHNVIGVSRGRAPQTTLASVHWVTADAGEKDSLRSLFADADTAILAVRAEPGAEANLARMTTSVLDAAAASGTRVLVIGGAGPLRTPHDHDLLVADDPRYVPPQVRAVAAASIGQLHACRRHPDADWTYLSPPALLAPGERTGRYRRGTQTLLIDPTGISRISAEDLAVAVLDEIELPSRHHHLTVASAPLPPE
ncbi:NAD(P)-dependent oxidoreductase [Ruania rhizosphaerae]|uniref:NAD(P)-dependent oxidoreductase n=1 Tax=Ruania rhizosphaerae TaxID=1840413 RepID=UPI00135AEEDA|nr:NAD(P)H-binding protein [Ruania rhizosphaerae]